MRACIDLSILYNAELGSELNICKLNNILGMHIAMLATDESCIQQLVQSLFSLYPILSCPDLAAPASAA